MPDWLGVLGWGVVLLCIALGAWVVIQLRRRTALFSAAPAGRGAAPEIAEPEGAGRLTLLESLSVDGGRRLMLLKCDDVEHLVLVGGPADVIVESDVQRVRQPRPPIRPQKPRPVDVEAAATPPKPIDKSPPQPAAGAQGQPEPNEPRHAPPAAPAADAPVQQPPRPALAAVATGRPPAANGQTPPPAAREPGPAQGATAAPRRPEPQRNEPATPIKEDAAGRAARQARSAETRVERREPPTMPRASTPEAQRPEKPSQAPQPLAADRKGKADAIATTIARPGSVAPAATDGDSVESEIVKAFRMEARPAAVPSPQEHAPAGERTTTLGDLAERLEEALAREVQSASRARPRLELGLEAFGFDRPAEPPPEAAAPPRPEPRLRSDPVKLPPAPGPEPEPRRDEAPVISLNARRREAVDPLEDEMARLLGELSGDSGRR